MFSLLPSLTASSLTRMTKSTSRSRGGVVGGASRRSAADQVAAALTLVSSIFGVAKDTLACSYVAAATRTRAPTVNVESLAAGAGSA